MKKLIAVLGSSRPGSISMKAAEAFIKGAEEAGYSTVVFNGNDMNLKGCTGCKSCRSNGVDCVINDDMRNYLNELHSADALLITSPNYYAQIAGPMITFMNRHYCLSNPDKTSRIKNGIKLSAIFSQGAPKDYPKYTPVYDWYTGTFISKGMNLYFKRVIGGDSDLDAVCLEAYNAGRLL